MGRLLLGRRPAFYLHLCGIIKKNNIRRCAYGTGKPNKGEQFTEELARREAALAAREEQLAQEQAELAAQKADFEEGKRGLLNNGDKNFVNAKEKCTTIFR